MVGDGEGCLGVSGEGWCQVSKSTKLREFVTITSASLPI